jgi:hypothetical protein
MALITPDFSDVAESVGPGTYKCRVVDAKFDEWGAKGDKPATPYITWSLETFDEAEPRNNGRRIFHKTPLRGGGAFRLQQFYTAAMKQPLKGEFDTEMLFGKEMLVTVVDGVTKDGSPSGYTEVKAVKAL